MNVPDYRARALNKLACAERAFDAGIYASCAIDAYLASLHAAREIVFKATLVRPGKPEAVRRRLTTLVWQGLEFDPKLLPMLKEGYRTMLRLDYGPRIVGISRTRAEEYLTRARAACE